MDNSNGNRMYLNFGNSNDRQNPASDRANYPTTPSTFPQPVFPPHSGQAGGLQPSQQAYQTSYAPQGYFMQNHYPPNYPAQPQGNDYLNPYQPRSNTPGTNDPNTGLAHQFSHQNLGGAARAQAYNSRNPSPAQRPRTAGAPGQPSSYASYPNAPVPSSTSAAPEDFFTRAPERNPDKYGSNANNNQVKCSKLAADFFKDSVRRARERNQRCVPLLANTHPLCFPRLAES